MKKSLRKLVLRRDTIQVLGSVGNVGLGHVQGGGGAALVFESDTQSGINCPVQVVALVIK